MLGRGHRQLRVRAQRLVVHQRFVVAPQHQFAHPRLETQRPVERLGRMPAPGIGMQVVHDVAAADQQDALVAQRPQQPAQPVVERRRLRLVDGKLHHRHVGGGKHMAQHRPGAAVQSPRKIRAHLQRLQQFAHAAHQAGIAGRRVLHLEQLAREAAEIVDRARRRRRGDRGAGQVPVRRHRQHRARPRQALAERRPASAPVVVLQRVHRVAVPEEDRRHACVHGITCGSAGRSS